jgi:invasion protein IalB
MAAMMIGRLTLPAALAAWFLAAAPAAHGQAIERLGDFGDWSAFRFKENDNTACYMASQPTKAEGDYTSRGDIYGLVTHRPAEDRRDEVSFIAGYDYKTNSLVAVSISGADWQLFTHKDGAWAESETEDKKLVQAMIKGSTMVVKGTSSRGTVTTDTYSLIGFTKAYQAISKACGL